MKLDMCNLQPIFTVVALMMMSVSTYVQAKLPDQASLSHYKILWENSALTREPKAAATEAASQLQEWLLGGVLDLGGDYMVTLKHKTKPESQRFNLNELKTNSATGFELTQVKMNPKNWKETKVAFKDNKGKINWIAFDLNRKNKEKAQPVAVARANANTGTAPPQTAIKRQPVTKKKIFYNKSSSQPTNSQSSP